VPATAAALCLSVDKPNRHKNDPRDYGQRAFFRSPNDNKKNAAQNAQHSDNGSNNWPRFLGDPVFKDAWQRSFSRFNAAKDVRAQRNRHTTTAILVLPRRA